ncbi:MAG: hypothetical protein JNL02_10570 [Saprospiraceae bacterium]|nr:hypothetical protein [Saprospiraceae bacterium]
MKKNFPQRKQAGSFSNEASFFIQKQALMPRAFGCFQKQEHKIEKIPTGVIHIVSKKPIFCKYCKSILWKTYQHYVENLPLKKQKTPYFRYRFNRRPRANVSALPDISSLCSSCNLPHRFSLTPDGNASLQDCPPGSREYSGIIVASPCRPTGRPTGLKIFFVQNKVNTAVP